MTRARRARLESGSGNSFRSRRDSRQAPHHLFGQPIITGLVQMERIETKIVAQPSIVAAREGGGKVD